MIHDNIHLSAWELRFRPLGIVGNQIHHASFQNVLGIHPQGPVYPKGPFLLLTTSLKVQIQGKVSKHTHPSLFFWTKGHMSPMM